MNSFELIIGVRSIVVAAVQCGDQTSVRQVAPKNLRHLPLKATVSLLDQFVSCRRVGLFGPLLFDRNGSVLRRYDLPFSMALKPCVSPDKVTLAAPITSHGLTALRNRRVPEEPYVGIIEVIGYEIARGLCTCHGLGLGQNFPIQYPDTILCQNPLDQRAIARCRLSQQMSYFYHALCRILRRMGENGEAVVSAEDRALERYKLIEPFLQGARTLTSIAAQADVNLRTAQRWVDLYRRNGLEALSQKQRMDRGTKRAMSQRMVETIEGLAL